MKHKFLRKESTEQDVNNARELDREKKLEHKEAINSSKYRTESQIRPGDLVLVRDWSRKSKYDPIFLPSPFLVQELNKEMKNVLLQDLNSTRTLLRHLDDIKECHHFIDIPSQSVQYKQTLKVSDLEKIAKHLVEEDHKGENIFSPNFPVPDPIPDQVLPHTPPRRSTRIRRTRQRYIEMC